MSEKLEKQEVVIDSNNLMACTSSDIVIGDETLDSINWYFKRVKEEMQKRSSTPIDIWGGENFDDPDDILL